MKFSLQIPAQPGYFVLDLVRDETGYLTVDKVGFVAWAFSHAEARLLAAFRKVKNRQQNEMLTLTEFQAKDFSVRTKPVFQLIAGGAA